MPRERVDPDDGVFGIQVGWSTDVQVAVTEKDQRSIFWTLLGGSQVELLELGKWLRRLHEESFEGLSEFSHDDVVAAMQHGGPEIWDEIMATHFLNQLDVLLGGACNGLWTYPDRQDINRLIKLLRKARDSAYGRDE